MKPQKPTTKQHPLETIHTIRLKNIVVSGDNVRLSDPTKDVDELAASIEKHGLLQPVVLLGRYGNPPYKLISGQRRFLAHKKLKKAKIRAVFTGALSKDQAVVRSLVENLQRLNLDHNDTAKAVTYLYKKYDNNEKKVQKETGLSLRKIRDLILIESRATTKMKRLMKADKVKPADVKRAILAAQDDLQKAEELIDLIIQHKPTYHQKRRLVLYGGKDKKVSATKILSEAMKPHIERKIYITLPEDVRRGLAKATESMSVEAEELAGNVLSEWLRNQGFLR